jgi:hypothetical protein
MLMNSLTRERACKDFRKTKDNQNEKDISRDSGGSFGYHLF